MQNAKLRHLCAPTQMLQMYSEIYILCLHVPVNYSTKSLFSEIYCITGDQIGKN